MKDKLIRYPIKIHEILEEVKEKSGISINAYIQEAIIKKLVHDKYLVIKSTTILCDKDTGKIVESIPEELKYCDGDKCQVRLDDV